MVPESLHAIASFYIEQLDRGLPGLLIGLYAHGSLALGAYDPRQSDIDLVVLTSRRCTPHDCTMLEAIHRAVHERYPQSRLEVTYIIKQDLGQFPENLPQVPYYHDGTFHHAGYFEINTVTWWVLKHYGVRFYGPAVAELNIPVCWEELTKRMRENVNTYWARWAHHPLQWLPLLNDAGVEWAVLGVLRPLHTLRNGAIVSKIAAGEGALEYLPQRYHQVVREALALRRKEGTPKRRRLFPRMIDAIHLLRYTVAECNRIQLATTPYHETHLYDCPACRAATE